VDRSFHVAHCQPSCARNASVDEDVWPRLSECRSKGVFSQGELVCEGSFAIEFLERESHLRRLKESFSLAQQGRGRIVAIAGEAGTGKTTLVQRFIEGVGAGAHVHRAACENLTTPEAWLPLRDIARASGMAFNAAADPLQAFEGVLNLLAEPGAARILVIEDLHWADSVTLDLVRYLARRIGHLNALVLLTYRDEEVDARSPIRAVLGEAPPGIVGRETVEPLSLDAVMRLAESAGRSGPDLFALTAGNPFLVMETLAVEGSVPTASVRDATLARVARLPPAAREVLEAVSVFPRRAETAIVEEMVASPFEAGVDACIERGMLNLEGAMLRFKHELARRAVEACVAPSRRRKLHQIIVDELVTRSTARASEIAHHAERAGDVVALAHFGRRAGDESARAGAPREAAAHYGAILNLRDRLPAPLVVELLELYADQCYLMGAADVAMVSMQEAAQLRRLAGETLKLGRDLTRLARFAWMCANRQQAETFAVEAIRVLEVAPAGIELAWAYSHKAQLDMLASEMATAVEWGNRALALAERLGDAEVLIHALGNIGSAQADNPDSGSIAELERSFDLAVAGGFHDHVERASCNLTCSHYVRRDYGAALRYIERGVAYALLRELTHWEGYLRGWRAMIRLDRGEWAAAEEEIGLILSRRYASAVYRFPALIALARLRIRRGDADADTPLDAAKDLAATLAELQRSVYVAVVSAEQAWLSPDKSDVNIETARARLEEVYSLAEERNARWVAEDAALWLHTLGQSVDSAAPLSSPFREHCAGDWKAAARGWFALARPYEQAMALSEGDEEAQRQALELFDALGAAPAAGLLRRLMRVQGARSIPRGPIAETRANPAGLTRRQLQVLALVEDGLSNVEIADRLCISVKTAEHHVSAIITRLEVGTRRAAASAARSLGILGHAKK
jgi:DNA-binding CsgD family transcriptional regulator/tetratricopeptide (TPR) repeat protein